MIKSVFYQNFKEQDQTRRHGKDDTSTPDGLPSMIRVQFHVFLWLVPYIPNRSDKTDRLTATQGKPIPDKSGSAAPPLFAISWRGLHAAQESIKSFLQILETCALQSGLGHQNHLQRPDLGSSEAIYFSHPSFHPVAFDRVAQPFGNGKTHPSLRTRLVDDDHVLFMPSSSVRENLPEIIRFSDDFFLGTSRPSRGVAGI
jgi:hypothetical protein